MKEIRQEMQLIEHTKDFHQNMTFDPIKDGTLGAASQQTTGSVEFTKIHPIQSLRKKYVKKCRALLSRVHTRM